MSPFPSDTIDYPHESAWSVISGIVSSFLQFELNTFDYVLYSLCLVGFCCWLLHLYLARRHVHKFSVTATDRENYREIFNSINEVVIIHDAETGAILDVNQAIFQTYGYTREEALSGDVKAMFDDKPPYDFKSALALIRKTARFGPQTQEWSGHRKDGSRIWNEISLKPVRIKDHDCVVAILRDVTERHNNYADMSRLSGIIENTADLVVTFAADLRLTYINTAGKKILLWQNNDVGSLGNILFRDLHPDEARNTVEFGIARAAFGGLWQGETFIRDTAGRTIPVSEVIIAHRDASGTIAYYSAIIRDLRQLKKAEEIVRAKLNLLTRPELDLGEVKLSSVFDIEELQKIQDAFAKATGCGSVITDPQGQLITRPSNSYPLCNMVRATAEGQKRCIRTEKTFLAEVSPERPFFTGCSCLGLWDGGTKIMLGGKHVANWLVGQVRNASFETERLQEMAALLGIERELFFRELEKIPVMSGEQFSMICNSLHLLAGQLSRMAMQNVQQGRIIHERNRAEKALRDNKEYLRSTLDSIGDGVIATDLSGNIITMNRTAEDLTGSQENVAAGKPVNQVLVLVDENTPSGGSIDLLETRTDRHSDPAAPQRTYTLRQHDGHDLSVEFSHFPLQDADGEIVGQVIAFRDTSKEHLLEDQLRQSQKMEAVGKLAGGIAHEFNNLLQVILGYGDMMAAHLQDEKQKNMLRQVLNAGNSAKKLVRQLLAFSRSGFEPEKSITDLNSVIADFKKMITRLLGEHISLKLQLEDKGLYAFVDPAQIEQVLMNLCLNARDAMPNGGEMAISIYKYVYDGKSEILPEITPGNYVCCEVKDSGTGIPPDLQKRIFEPFFTTKAVGQGTGLGLATSYGIIRKHDGIMTFVSHIGKGTTFRVLLPAISENHPFGVAAEPETASTPPSMAEPEEKAARTILLVEDEQTVRNLALLLLEDAGYRVLTASDGAEGIEMFDRHSDKINLALLDLVLPVKSGREVAEYIRRKDSGLPIIFCSGYNNDYIKAETITDQLIHKPYDAKSLVTAVENAIRKNTDDNNGGE